MGVIRFLLAVSVLIVHSSPVLGIEILPGPLAVRTFYIISGFYMTLIFTRKYSTTARPFYYFISNRLLRVYPLYALVVIMTLILSLFYGVWLGSFGKIQFFIDWYHRVPESAPSLLGFVFFNASLIGQDWISFFEITRTGTLHFIGLQENIKMQELFLIPIAWTVSVELFFYLLTPLIVRKNIVVVLGWLALVILLRTVLYLVFDVANGFGIYRFAPTELFWFLLGVLSFKLYHNNRLPQQRHGKVLFIVLIALLFSHKYIHSDVLIYGSVFLFLPAVFYRFSNYEYDRFVGELAYPLYISHCFFLLIVGANRFPKTFGQGLPLLTMTLVFSIVCYYYFLRPLDRFRSRRIMSGHE